jgi:diketogulonate reductase-like aldo/keto reductase
MLDFELSEEDMKKLDALDQGTGARIVDFSFFKG